VVPQVRRQSRTGGAADTLRLSTFEAARAARPRRAAPLLGGRSFPSCVFKAQARLTPCAVCLQEEPAPVLSEAAANARAHILARARLQRQPLRHKGLASSRQRVSHTQLLRFFKVRAARRHTGGSRMCSTLFRRPDTRNWSPLVVHTQQHFGETGQLRGAVAAAVAHVGAAAAAAAEEQEAQVRHA